MPTILESTIKVWGYLQKMFNYRPGHNRPESWLLYSEQWTTTWTNTTSYYVLWWPDNNNMSPSCYKSVVQLLKLSLVLSLSYRQSFPQPYLLEVIKGGILNSSHPCIVFLHFEFWLIWPYYSNIINWNKCSIDAPPKRQGKIRVIKIEILYWCTPTSVQMNFQLESLSLVLS